MMLQAAASEGRPFRTLWRRRWLVLGFLGAALAIGALLAVTMPKAYQSSATIIVPKESAGQGLLSGLAAAASVQQVPGLSLPSLTPNRDLLVSLLKSRTLAQAVVQRFGLVDRYHARSVEDAIKRLRSIVLITVSREGVIGVRVEDSDPGLAAELANFHIEQLDRLTARYITREAGHQREFLTEQLARAKAQLDETERALRQFQESNRAIVLQDQTRGAIEAAARLKGEIMAAEVQLQVMRNFVTDANPDAVALRRRIDEMNRQLSMMQYGDGARQAAGPSERRDFAVPFARVPSIGLELARLTRDVKVQETLVTLLAQQVEQARLAEARDLPLVQVLDGAVPAERPVRPSIGFNLAVAGFGGLVVGISLVFLLEWSATDARGGRLV
jgi:tyrosine-protein kinase Etk/Wzc